MKEPQSKAEAPQAATPAPAIGSTAVGGAAAVGQARELSSGRPLGAAVRPRFEQALSADLGDVRVHTDSAAVQMAADHGAHAVAVGQDIYGPSANLDAGSPGGLETLAHEVIHTVQSQRAGAAAPMASSDASSRSADAAEVEARSGAPAVAAGQAFQVRQAPSAPAMLSAQTIEDAIDDATKSVADIQTTISREHPNTHINFLHDAAKVTKLVARFNGNQMFQALTTMRGDTAANKAVFRLNLLRRAGGPSAANVQEMVRAANAAELPGVYADATLMAFLQTMATGGPLSMFRQESNGLSAGAEGSAAFMTWLLADTTAFEVLRVLGATGRASLIATLTALPTGWGWLATLPGGAGLTPAQMAHLMSLRNAAPAGSAERARIDAKIAEPPIAATPAEAQAQLTALLATATPDENSILSLVGALSAADRATLAGALGPVVSKLTGANVAQLLTILGLALSPALTAMKAAGVTDAATCQDVMRGAPVADRVAVAGDAALTTWLLGVVPDSPPMALFSVQAGEEAQFIEKQPFFEALLARMTGTALLQLLGDTAWMSTSASMMDANAAASVAFLNTLPGVAELGIERRTNTTTHKQHGEANSSEMRLRGLRLATTSGAINAWIDAYFDDMTAPDAHATQTSADPSEENYVSPRQRLDAAINAGDEPGVLDAIGALQGDELNVVRRNTDGVLGRLSSPLGDETYYQAMRSLQIAPKDQIYYLVEEEWGGGAARFQGILGGATDAELHAVLGWDYVVDELEDEIEGGPAPIFKMSTAVPDWALGKDEFRGWLLDETEPTQLVRILAPTAAPILDSHDDWGWVDDLPDEGMMLTVDERARLLALRNASLNADAVNRMTEILGNTDHTAASPADALTQLTDELDDVFVDETLCLCMATQLDASGRATIIATERAHAVAAFNAEEMARFTTALQVPAVTALDWMQGAGSPTRAQVQAVLDRASAPELTGLLGNAAAVALCQSTLDLAPAMAMPALTLSTATALESFWTWTLEKVEPYEALRLLAVNAANVDLALGFIETQKTRAWFDTLPKGIGLAPPARAHLDAIYPSVTSADWQKTFFMLRFDCTLSGGWADASGPTGGDLKALYAQLVRLPLEQVANNRFLSIFNRTGAGTGGSYSEGSQQVNAGADQTFNKTLYDGEPHAYTEQYFAHTIRHEVGHAVDASLGSRTALCFDMAGWHEYPEGSAEQFIDDQSGFIDDGGGPPLTAVEKASVVSAVRSFMNTAGARIAGPGRSIMDMLPDDHILKARPDIRFAKALSNTGGQMHYTNAYDDGTTTWSINYYYQRWMKVKSSAANSAPRDYTLFAPAEYFADMYAEFYRNYDGTPATEPALGGNVPAAVKTWLMNNVHTVGYDPHNRRDAGGPATGVGRGGHP